MDGSSRISRVTQNNRSLDRSSSSREVSRETNSQSPQRTQQISIFHRSRLEPVNAPRADNAGPSSSHESEDTPRPLNDHLRSISLPQALHSFSLSNRPSMPHSKRTRHSNLNTSEARQEGSSGVSAEHNSEANRSGFGSRIARIFPFASMGDNNDAGDSSNLTSNSGLSPIDTSIDSSVDTTMEEMTPNSTIPMASSSNSPIYLNNDIFGSGEGVPKRSVSQGHTTTGVSAPSRSQTTPRLSYLYYGIDTEILDPPTSSSTKPELDSGIKPDKFEGRRVTSESEVEDASLLASFTDADFLHTSNSSVFAPLIEEGVASVDPRTWGAAQRALNTPDILKCIFEALDSYKIVPHELVQQRRKPLSLRHAQLMFGDTKKAVEALQYTQPTTTPESPAPGLYNCLLVNSTWYDAAVKVLDRQIFFRSSEHWLQFARRGASSLSRKPRKLVLHKLGEAMQVEIDLLDTYNLGEQLEWLEFYTCAGIAPSPSLLGSQLTKIILPGCFRVNDRTMAHIAERCPQLRHLDIRACELVTDRGIKLIAKYCPQLELLNVGRTQGGEYITYKGIKHLARQTQLSTLGIAGCHVDDRAVWELALNRGPKLERLSFNNCSLLSDFGIPKALGYMPNLTVLEIRGCVHITNMKPLVMFKSYRERQGQPPLIEGCEVIERRLQEATNQLHRERNNRIFNDLECWANLHEPSDNYVHLIH